MDYRIHSIPLARLSLEYLNAFFHGYSAGFGQQMILSTELVGLRAYLRGAYLGFPPIHSSADTYQQWTVFMDFIPP